MRLGINRSSLISQSALPIKLYLAATARNVTVKVALEKQGRLTIASPEGLRPAFREMTSCPTLFPFWNAHSVLLLCAYLALSPIRRELSKIEAAADDSVGGILTQALYERLGLTGRQLRWTSPEKRLSDLKTLFLEMPNLAMACDSHGPYRSITAGMARITRQYRGHVIPLSAISSRSFNIFSTIRMAVPMPLAVIIVGIGSPLDSTSHESLPTISKELASALSRLEANLKALISRPTQ